MTSPAAGKPQDRATRAALVGGCLLAALLVVIILVRYPGNAATATSYLTLGGSGLAVLLTMGVWFALRGPRLYGAADAGTDRLGVLAGLASGLLWVLEISFNNFVPPAISTGAARTVVDSAVLAIVVVGILVVGVVGAFRTGRTRPGLLAGYWSGLVSGLIACLMGLLLIVVWMRFLLRDPLMISEYAERGAADGAPDLATYIAYETLTGALLHLVILGLVLGLLLGAPGGVAGRGLALLRRRRP